VAPVRPEARSPERERFAELGGSSCHETQLNEATRFRNDSTEGVSTFEQLTGELGGELGCVISGEIAICSRWP
jgi:hypothetical protein